MDFEHHEVLYIGGFGSGKTYAGARKFIYLTLHNEGSLGLITAPTMADINRIMIDELKQVCEEWGLYFAYNQYGTKHLGVRHLVIGNNKVLVISAEEPKRFTGFQIGHAWVDEAARVKWSRTEPLNDAPTQIRSRIRCPKAKLFQLLLTSTPEGKDNWLQEQFIDRPIPQRAYYVGSSLKNSALSKDYIDLLKATYDKDMAKQYLEGIAVDFAGAIAHGAGFTQDNIRDIEWDFSKCWIACDFNVAPMTWIAAQKRGDDLYIMDELYITNNASIEQAVRLANDKGWAMGDKSPRELKIIPDKSAKNRNTQGDSEWDTLKKFAKELGWRFTGTVEGANPDINNRIANVSSLILNSNGVRRLFIHPRCERLIKEIQTTKRLRNGHYDPGKDKDRGHILDALGYLCYELFPMIKHEGPRINNNFMNLR